jgi:hypothetical protein
MCSCMDTVVYASYIFCAVVIEVAYVTTSKILRGQCGYISGSYFFFSEYARDISLVCPAS